MEFGTMGGVAAGKSGNGSDSSSTIIGGSLYNDSTLGMFGTWMLDYKTYGENSYVFVNKDIWNTLLGSVNAVNDKATASLAIQYAINQGVHFGNVMSKIYGIDTSIDWESLSTPQLVVNNIDAVKSGLNHSVFYSTMLELLKTYKTYEAINNDSQYIDAIVNGAGCQKNKRTAKEYTGYALLIKGDRGYTNENGNVFRTGIKYTDLAGNNVTLAENINVLTANDPGGQMSFTINKIVTKAINCQLGSTHSDYTFIILP